MVDLGAAGVILGALFSRSSFELLESLPDNAFECSNIDKLAAWLIEECWGAYVAVHTNCETGEVHILVDPSGLLPVYCAETATHRIFASHPELLRRVSGFQLVPSWPAVYAHLSRPDLRQRAACLAGVNELAPGKLIGAGERQVSGRQIWWPDDFMPSTIQTSYEEAALHLRELATSVIGAWAMRLGRVAVAASGGVDSSLICAALAKAGQPFDCVTLATADPSGDERSYVRKIGDHLGINVRNKTYDIREINPLACVSTGLARPSRKPFMAALDAALCDAGQNLGAEVVFDGNGGDNLFCFLHSAAPLIDRLLCEGPGRGSAATLVDLCHLTGCSMPTMLRAAVVRLFRKRPSGLWPADLRLLSSASEQHECAQPLTSWLNTMVGRHRGKYDHLVLLMRNQNYVNGLAAGGVPRFSPLLSQPLVEYCLGVPTWVWCAGGINRAPARAAFAAELPREILERVSKAGPDSFVRLFFDKYRQTYRELLLEGLLARHGLLDRKAVEAAFNVDFRSEGSIIYRLLDLVETENWARSWSS
ncbi:asparagine synthase-related protein [Parasphingorhabdus sp. JC815]|uniref:asparagine synthase-related protein n=1 Tax=Parasphingorhabdus sp. JC815 TaxID=3232140 RepID=UPI00345AAF8C